MGPVPVAYKLWRPPPSPQAFAKARLATPRRTLVASFARRWTRPSHTGAPPSRFCKRGYNAARTPVASFARRWTRPSHTGAPPSTLLASAATSTPPPPRSQLRKEDGPAPPHTAHLPPRFCKRGYKHRRPPRSQLRKKMDPPAAYGRTTLHAFASAAATPPHPRKPASQENWPGPPPQPPTLLQAWLKQLSLGTNPLALVGGTAPVGGMQEIVRFAMQWLTQELCIEFLDTGVFHEKSATPWTRRRRASLASAGGGVRRKFRRAGLHRLYNRPGRPSLR